MFDWTSILTESTPYLIIGIGSAILAIVMTFMMPVSSHRVNQNLISIIIAVLVFVAAFALFEIPLALVVAIGGTAVAIIYRDIVRWIRGALWHNVFRYTHRYYWYNRVGRAIIGPGQRGRRRKK